MLVVDTSRCLACLDFLTLVKEPCLNYTSSWLRSRRHIMIELVLFEVASILKSSISWGAPFESNASMILRSFVVHASRRNALFLANSLVSVHSILD